MSLPSSGGAAILRAAQKDEYFIKRLSANASEALRLFGNKTWNKYSKYITDASSVAYGYLTTMKDLQTLGEEYTGILQVDDSYVKLPHKIYQLTYILMNAFGETFVRKILNKLRSDIQHNEELLPNVKQLLLKFITILIWTIPILKDLHQSWFYMGGKHHEISKRLMGINYVNAVPGATLSSSLLTPLGIPCFLRAILNAVRSPPSFDDLDLKGETTEMSNNESSCPGCLDSNLTPCALPCGHILCNSCARGSYVCSLCRAPYHPNRTVPLQNFQFA